MLSFWKFFIDNSKFTLLLAAAAAVFGLIAAVQMPKESQPEVNIPIGVVATAFPGASVEDVELLVTNVIEDKLSGLDQVDSITSESKSGISSIIVQFDADADTDLMIADLKDAVDLAKVDLPGEAKDPFVTQVSLDDAPFLTLGLSGPFEVAQLKVYADELKSEIERVGHVSSVQIFGGRDREVQVIVNKESLDNFGFSLPAVVQAISQANSDIPIGSIITANEEYSLRFAGRLESTEEVASVPVGQIDGIPVFVRDIATVSDGYSEPKKTVQLSIAGQDAEPSVSIRVFKSSGGDVTRIAKDIILLSEQISEERFPASVHVQSIENLADNIERDLVGLMKNGIATVIIVSLLLALFLGWREALMSAIAIPMSFLITFIILANAGYSINFMTLFSLILSLGILVDSTIVINESLHKKMLTNIPPAQAALESVKELQYPLITVTLTTVFAFLPMLLTGGLMGQFIKSIPITVTAVLCASLFVALAVLTTLTVVLAERTRKKARAAEQPAHAEKTRFAKLFDQAREAYGKALDSLLAIPAQRKKLKNVLIVLFVLAYALPITGILPAQLFPAEDADSFSIDLEGDFGTPLEETQKAISAMAKSIENDKDIASLVINSGFGGNLGSQSGGSEGSHLAHIVVNLAKDRDVTSFELLDRYQKQFAHSEFGVVSVTQQGYGPGSAAPVELTISGTDLEELDRLADQYVTLVSAIDGTQNVKSSVITTNGQFVTHIDRARAAQYGVTASDVAYVLRAAVNGVSATQITQDGDDADVIVRYGLSNAAFDPAVENKRKTDLGTIEGITIATRGGDVPLLSIASIELENSRAGISHEEGERVVKITSYLRSDVSPASVFTLIEKQMTDITLPDGYAVKVGGEDEDTKNSLNDMFRAMILAGILIAALMVLQFRSFKQAGIILTTIPLALIGVFPGLLLVGKPLSFPGMIGIVALAGIVVNNAIILIDKINSSKEEGMSLTEALINGGKARLEPIVLTTITTVFGILPLAITQPLWASLGYAIIFGLLFSTMLTLFVVPLLYNRAYKKKTA